MIVLQASCSTSSKAHNPTRTGLSYSCYGDGAVAFNTVSCCYHRGLCSLCEFCVRMVSSWYKRTAPRLLGASSIEIPILVGMEGRERTHSCSRKTLVQRGDHRCHDDRCNHRCQWEGVPSCTWHPCVGGRRIRWLLACGLQLNTHTTYTLWAAKKTERSG